MFVTMKVVVLFLLLAAAVHGFYNNPKSRKLLQSVPLIPDDDFRSTVLGDLPNYDCSKDWKNCPYPLTPGRISQEQTRGFWNKKCSNDGTTNCRPFFLPSRPQRAHMWFY
uniref:Kringle domain-containing protein n=1 Tax=Steinernema glaseri TaxID=37863 RepID=A0A1I7ZGK6_9BILA